MTNLYEYIFAAFSFVLGATVGSFLNVCVYRMPRGMGVNKPARSFCPHCEKQIPWHRNIPLLSWLALRGRCADCGAPIAFRYFVVELLTALLFLGIWLRFGAGGDWILVFPYFIFVSLLVVATFIDFEHFIIPDEITWGGVGAGLVLSFAIPTLMDRDSNLAALLQSLLGAGLGFALLWIVVELGKLAFGRKKIPFDKPTAFEWTRHGDEAEFTVGDEKMPWSEIFSREKDQLIMTCPEVEVDGSKQKESSLRFFYNRLDIGGTERPLDQIDVIRGQVTEIVIPREAMGFGDVKFIAAIGAFLGWQAVLFTVMAASVTGAIIGSATLLAGKREWSMKIPFGPYLALGALVWLFAGPELVDWYWQFAFPTGP